MSVITRSNPITVFTKEKSKKPRIFCVRIDEFV